MSRSRTTIGLVRTATLLLASLGPSLSVSLGSPWTNLQAYLNGKGDPIPDGAGIRVALVEASNRIGQDPNYQYTYWPAHDPLQSGEKAFNDVSNKSGSYSTHAAGSASKFYGAGSITNGITDIDVYEADHWLATDPLDPNTVVRAMTTNAPRTFAYSAGGGNIQVASFSWIGGGSDTEIEDILRRTDLLVDRDNVIMTPGILLLSNPLLGEAYNVISVGALNVAYVSPTAKDLPGRIKPDIVTSGSTVSNSAPTVGSRAAFLVDSALNYVGDAQGANAEAVKAILMAGATKPTGWARYDTGGYIGPLDNHSGAGEVNIYNSYRILEGGQQEGYAGTNLSNNAGTYGWDFDTLSDGQQKLYYFEIPTGQTASEVSILTTWHRRIAENGFHDPDGYMLFTPSLANLNLRLHTANAAGTLTGMIDESVSTLDNVEHVYQTNLGPGRYAFELTYEGDDLGVWDYAIAWRGENFLDPTPMPIPEPATVSLLLLGGLGLLFLRRHRRRGPIQR